MRGAQDSHVHHISFDNFDILLQPLGLKIGQLTVKQHMLVMIVPRPETRVSFGEFLNGDMRQKVRGAR